MFDYVGKRLIKLMQHSGSVPGAINAKDLSTALRELQNALENEINLEEDGNDAYNEEEVISLNKRAVPLIDLLKTAIENEEGVMWDIA
jgi:hypothetical protein